MTLPEGWKAKLPPMVQASSAFGTYSAEYVQEGRTLRIVHRVTGADGIYPPERVTELTAWFKKMATDNAKVMVLERVPR